MGLRRHQGRRAGRTVHAKTTRRCLVCGQPSSSALFWLRPRPRHLEASLGVSHGGVAVIAAPGVRLTSVNIGVDGVSEMHRLF